MVVLPSLSSYDAKAVRLLSGVLFDVNRTVERASRAPLSENDRANVTRLVADRLMRDFELGERNYDALKRTAMDGLKVRLASGRGGYRIAHQPPSVWTQAWSANPESDLGVRATPTIFVAEAPATKE